MLIYVIILLRPQNISSGICHAAKKIFKKYVIDDS